MKHFFADAYFGLIGLLFFFTFFCVVSLWTFRPGSKDKYKDLGNIPLQENEE